LEVGSVSDSGIETAFTKLVGIRYPIVAAPMFLVSAPRLVAAVSEAGGLGAMPAHNFRPLENLESALAEVRSLTSAPFAVNIIVNKANPYREEHIRACLKAGVPVLITSLGNPEELIKEAHKNGAKVFCDVVDLSYALKVQDLGADGVVAVGAGAGGHAGRITPQVLVPYLKESITVPILAAGGIATGRGLLAALSLGADAAYIGTRFIASSEADVSDAYKQAILKNGPEDIIYTARITGTHGNFIRTPDLERKGTEVSRIERFLYENRWTKKWSRGLKVLSANKKLERSARGGGLKPWKDLWSAGQGVGLVHEVKPAAQIVAEMVAEYEAARTVLPPLKE
jgi:nitronate monooxygenase